jgi:4-hydroxy-tetrahydrodipicolinate reductase
MNAPLAIVGYGKMGRLVDQLAAEYGFTVTARLGSADSGRLSAEILRGATTAIEFTNASAVPANLRMLAALNVNTVCGTTGWHEQIPAIRKEILSAGTALVYGPNFSIGVNLFMQMVGHAAGLFSPHSQYEAWAWEIHHSAKKDSPSGTLKKLAEEVRAAGFDGSLTLSANRAGAHPGTHEIGFDSAEDTITLRHTARSREGFARGALSSARWIAGKKGVYEFREIVGELERKKSEIRS